MAADIYVAEDWRADRADPPGRSIWLANTGCYWHLYRYSEDVLWHIEFTKKHKLKLIVSGD